MAAQLLGAGSCARQPEPVIEPLSAAVAAPFLRGGAGRQAGVRVDGPIGSRSAPLGVQTSRGVPGEAPADPAVDADRALDGAGDITLELTDTDLREIVAQVLGSILKVNYTIDPAVRGTASFRTARPMSRRQLLAALQTMLAQNGAALVRSDNFYRVLPAAAATAASGSGPAGATSGSTVLTLRYAAAEELAKVLQPFVQSGGRIIGDPARNALIIDGEPGTREALVGMAQAFDINMLSGQSYALIPAGAGSLKDFAAAIQDALRGQGGASLAGLVRVVPMERVNAVLVVSNQPRYIEEARRVVALVERGRQLTTRSWNVVYLQNSPTNEVAYVLQRAFTPGDITAQPGGGAGPGGSGLGSTSQNGGPGGGSGTGLGSGQGVGQGMGQGMGQGVGQGVGQGNGGSGGGQLGASGGFGGALGGGIPGTAGGLSGAGGRAPANPLLGGLGGGPSGGGEANPDGMRIIPNPQNNAVLIYGTNRELETAQAMIRKIDILPLQVRIDAVIAEVTLNDTLRYGTQFYFKSGGLNGIFSAAAQNLGSANLTSAVFNTTLPGLIAGGAGAGGAPFVISALQGITDVQVLSSPQLMVLDNQPARLQVGNVVPYLSQTSQSTITNNSPVISSINYQQTGVVMQVTPRVNSGGLVTLDIAQEVSDVAASVTTPGINSPTFLQRSVSSRVVVQDGQTIGIAGLIRDNVAKQNSGIPWLKDIPLLGLLAGQQNNVRDRTELIVLITPHVVHDQRDARNLTEDLREHMVSAAAVPETMRNLRLGGSADPNETMRRRLRLQP